MTSSLPPYHTRSILRNWSHRQLQLGLRTWRASLAWEDTMKRVIKDTLRRWSQAQLRAGWFSWQQWMLDDLRAELRRAEDNTLGGLEVGVSSPLASDPYANSSHFTCALHAFTCARPSETRKCGVLVQVFEQ